MVHTLPIAPIHTNWERITHAHTQLQLPKQRSLKVSYHATSMHTSLRFRCKASHLLRFRGMCRVMVLKEGWRRCTWGCMGMRCQEEGAEGLSVSISSKQSQSWQLSLPEAHLCPGSGYYNTGWERHFFWLKGLQGWINLTKEFIPWNLKCQWIRVGDWVWKVEWGVEQHKWSKPFGAAVSSKLIPLSLIPDITWTKSHRCRYLLFQTACGCGFLSAQGWMWGSTSVSSYLCACFAFSWIGYRAWNGQIRSGT